MERLLERLTEQGLIDKEAQAQVQAAITEEFGLPELGRRLLEAEYWGMQDIYTDAEDYQDEIENLQLSLFETVKTFDSYGSTVESLNKIRNHKDTDENLRVWILSTLITRKDVTDRGAVLRELAEHDPDGALRYLERIDDTEIAEFTPEDLEPLLRADRSKLRARAMAILPRIQKDAPEHDTPRNPDNPQANRRRP